jgi:hypothetical protein
MYIIVAGCFGAGFTFVFVLAHTLQLSSYSVCWDFFLFVSFCQLTRRKERMAERVAYIALEVTICCWFSGWLMVTMIVE